MKEGLVCARPAFTYQNRKESRRGGCQPVPGSSVLGGKYLRRDCVQNPIHNLSGPIAISYQSFHVKKSMTALTLLQNAYPQFHPNNPPLLPAVVLPNKKTPVKTENGPIFSRGRSLNNVTTEIATTSACLKKLPAFPGGRDLEVPRPIPQAGIQERLEH